VLLICSSAAIDQKLGYTVNVYFISPLKITLNKMRKWQRKTEREREREREPKSDYLSWGLLSPFLSGGK